MELLHIDKPVRTNQHKLRFISTAIGMDSESESRESLLLTHFDDDEIKVMQ